MATTAEARSTIEETLAQLQEAAPEKVGRKWLDEHAEDVARVCSALGVTATARALGMSPNSLKSWRQWRGLETGPGAGRENGADAAAGGEGGGGSETVALARIDANPWQPRRTVDPEYIEALAASIAHSGLLQPPVGRRTAAGRVQLAFGHQRVRAIWTLAEAGTWDGGVPVTVRELTDQQMALFALEENAKRRDVSALEQLQAYQKVIDDGLMTVTDLAASLGLARPTVSNNLRILNLPKAALDRFGRGDLSAHAARELLAFWTADHCHEREIQAVLDEIAGTTYGAPDWRVASVRAKMREQVAGRYRREWRPLAAKATGGGHLYGSAYSPPTFDVAAFAREHPAHVHHIPNGSGTVAWTCNVREWQRRQSAATRAAGKAAQDAPATLGERETAKYLDALARDPVVQAIRAGADVAREPVPVSQETGGEAAADDPKAAAYRAVNAWVTAFLSHQWAEETEEECDLADTPDACPGCAGVEDAVDVQVLRTRLELGALTDGQIGTAVERAMAAWEEGEDLADGEPPAPPVDVAQLDEATRGQLGSRGGFLRGVGPQPSFKKALQGYDLPRGFDLPECLTRCTWGAVYGDGRYGGTELYCTNAKCYQDKAEAGKARFVRLVDKRRQRDAAQETEALATLRAMPQADRLRSVALALMAEQQRHAVRQYGGWSERELWRERVATANVRALLGVEDRESRDVLAFQRTYGELVDPAIVGKLDAMKAEDLQELLVNLAAYTFAEHRDRGARDTFEDDDDA